MAKENQLSRRELFRAVASGLALASLAFDSSLDSRVLGNEDFDISELPKTNIILSEQYIEAVKRVNTCLNIDDVHCTYRKDGNCSRCYMLEYFVTEDKP